MIEEFRLMKTGIWGRGVSSKRSKDPEAEKQNESSLYKCVNNENMDGEKQDTNQNKQISPKDQQEWHQVIDRRGEQETKEGKKNKKE